MTVATKFDKLSVDTVRSYATLGTAGAAVVYSTRTLDAFSAAQEASPA